MVVIAYLDEIFFTKFYQLFTAVLQRWTKSFPLHVKKTKLIISSRKNSNLFIQYSINLPLKDECDSQVCSNEDPEFQKVWR